MSTLDDDDGDRIPVVPFVPFRCPRCARHKPFTHKVRGRFRYHRCQHCGCKYKSIEVPASQVTGWPLPEPTQDRSTD